MALIREYVQLEDDVLDIAPHPGANVVGPFANGASAVANEFLQEEEESALQCRLQHNVETVQGNVYCARAKL